MILKADYINQIPIVLAAAFHDEARARDALDVIEAIEPTDIEYIDGEYITVAEKSGKKIAHFDEMTADGKTIATVLVVTINDFSSRTREKKLKKLQKQLAKFDAVIVHSNNPEKAEVAAAHGITDWFLNPEQQGLSAPPMLDGAYMPIDRFDVFASDIAKLAKKNKISLPLYGRPLDDLWYVRPQLRLTTTADKQKVFKLATEIAAIVTKHGGSVFGESGEGRLHTALASSMMSEAVQKLYGEIKDIFDPHHLLNPGVKQTGNVQELTKQLRSDYTAPHATHGVASY